MYGTISNMEDKRPIFGIPRSDIACSDCGEPAVAWRVIAYSYKQGNLLTDAPVSGVTGVVVAYYCKLHMRDADDSEVIEH